jgi:hypothetical protein
MDVDELGHSLANLIANPAHLIERLALRIVQWPIVTSKAGDIRALVATSHRHQQRCVTRKLLSQLLRAVRAQIDADLAHDFNHFRVHAFARLRSR